jgi:hypothetical protein
LVVGVTAGLADNGTGCKDARPVETLSLDRVAECKGDGTADVAYRCVSAPEQTRTVLSGIHNSKVMSGNERVRDPITAIPGNMDMCIDEAWHQERFAKIHQFRVRGDETPGERANIRELLPLDDNQSVT